MWAARLKRPGTKRATTFPKSGYKTAGKRALLCREKLLSRAHGRARMTSRCGDVGACTSDSGGGGDDGMDACRSMTTMRGGFHRRPYDTNSAHDAVEGRCVLNQPLSTAEAASFSGARGCARMVGAARPDERGRSGNSPAEHQVRRGDERALEGALKKARGPFLNGFLVFSPILF